ncbi:alcohol dehydrogenase [Pedobacter sp. KBW06]|uniref:zinc-binding dehydrogenase n=1 Tax=Pedobacter sp. KBW06 TaxID=2153359 RepID=UPI000F594980|nr:zinc-binding dehydrogenase [Pedobacter sp. KBW06]RQO75503.1 alcohol dehydrogenase [Pedobacter sp. KBW06]
MKGNIMVFEETGKRLTSEEREIPALRSGEVLIKNLYTTICGSDLHTFAGLRKEKTPTVLGHEIVGRIVAIDKNHPGIDMAGNTLAIGDLVTWAIFCSAPQENWLSKGMPQKSEDLFKYGHAQITTEDVFHGGLSEYCMLKEHTCILKVPDDLPLPIAATINCALATVAGAIRLAGPLEGKNILITGLGLLGNIAAAMSKVAGAKEIIAVDVITDRLEGSRAFGAGFAYSSLEEANLREILANHKIDIVFDMSGSPDAIELGIESLGIGGIAVWAGAVFKTRKIGIDAEQVIRKLITIKGLHNYNFGDLQYALNFIAEQHQHFPFSTVVSKEFPLEEAQEAFEYAMQHRPLRVGIKLNP